MTITVVQKSTPSVYTKSLTGSATLSAVTAGNAILAFVAHNNFSGNGAGTSVADGTSNVPNTFRETGYGATANSFSIECFSEYNVAAGSHTLQSTALDGTAANSYGQIQIWEVSGLSGATDTANTIGANNNSTTPGVGPTGTLAQAVNLAIAIFGNTGNSTAGITNPPTGFSSQYADSNTADPPFYLSTQVTAATTALHPTWGTLTTACKWAAGIVILEGANASAPTITNVNTTNTVSPGASIPINGTNFTNSSGNTVSVTAQGGTQSQTLTGQTTTLLTIGSFTLGNLPYGAATLTVTNTLGLQASIGITIVPASGVSTWQLGTLAALSFDTLGKPSVIYDAASEFGTQLIPNNALIESTITGGSGIYGIDSDGRLSWAYTVTQIQHRYWQPTLFWSSLSLWDLRAPFPITTGTINSQSFTNGTAIPAINAAVDFSVPDPTGGNVLTYSLSSNPGWESINSGTGSITGTPNANGTTNPVVTATDSYSSAVSLPAFSQIVNASLQAVVFDGGLPSTLSGTTTQAFNNFDVSSYFVNATSYSVSGLGASGLSMTGSVLGGTNPVAGTYTAVFTGSNLLPSSANSTPVTISITNPLQAGVVPTLQGTGPVTETFCMAAFSAVGLVGLFPNDWSGALSVVQNIAGGTSVALGTQVTVSPIGLAALSIKSPQLTAQELSPSTQSAYVDVQKYGICPMGSIDPTGTAYRLQKVPSSAVVVDVEVFNSANPTGSVYECGLLSQTQSGGGEVVTGSSAIFNPSFSLDQANSWVSIFNPQTASGISGGANIGLAVWQLLGLPADPALNSDVSKDVLYDVAVTAITPGQAGGTLALRIKWIRLPMVALMLPAAVT